VECDHPQRVATRSAAGGFSSKEQTLVIAEISVIIAGVQMASNALKSAAGAADDLSTIGEFLGKLGGAEVELAKAQNSGGLSEGDAIKTALARKQIADTLREIKDLFTISGNGHLYAECMAEMAKARVAKQEEIARLVRLRKQRNEELLQAGILILIFLVLLPAIVGGIGYMVINR
tara:strand:+ start:125 stop:652 length:528 start_codon:yes stop_codon:yes gene_type:complete